MKLLNRFILTLLFFLPVSPLFSQQNGTEDLFDLIAGRIVSAHGNISAATLERELANFRPLYLENGSFSDINYKDKSRTNWQPLTHLTRINRLVYAYTKEDCRYFGEDVLYDQILKLLIFWDKTKPVSDNWYMQQIATPQQLGIILLAARKGKKQLPKELENSLLQWIVKHGGDPDRKGNLGIGANKMDIATHWIYRGLLIRDTAILSKGIKQAFQPIRITTEEGYQPDLSYHQHGPQLYIGGYGKVMLEGIVNIAKYVYGTPYALSQEKIEIIRNFTLETFLPTTRGKLFLFNAVGRSLARHGGMGQQSVISLLKEMQKIDPDYYAEYEKGIQRIAATQPANYQIESKHAHYWRSDYTLHQRPNYTADVRFATIRTSRSEIINKENLLGYFLVDGAMSINKKGDEYENIFPVWDWSAVPGTTAPQLPSDKIPQVTPKKIMGNATFAGGVSDGLYGVTAYFQHDYTYKQLRLEAKKSWFFFDNEIVCLGAGITTQSKTKSNIRTTLNQCLADGNIAVTTNAGTDQIKTNDLFQLEDSVLHILHGKTGYLFPTPSSCTISKQTRSGNWNSISPVNRNETKEVFTLWIDHGVDAKNAQYQYIIIPDMNEENLIQTPLEKIKILLNSETIQAVYHQELDILGIVFYKPATFTEHDLIEISVDKPAIVMIRNLLSDSASLYISDPTYSAREITVSYLTEGMAQRKQFTLDFPLDDANVGKSLQYNVVKE